MISGADLPRTTHVLFDFFGTLVDYDPSVVPSSRNAPHEFALRQGLAVDPTAASALWQEAWAELESRALETGRECSLHEIAHRYAELIGAPLPLGDESIELLVRDYLDAWTANITLAPAAIECLADLGRDHVLAIVSNAHNAGLVPHMIKKHGIETLFECVITSIETGWRKPSPEIYEIALERLGTTADCVAFVGDTWDADIEGPTAMGMRAFYVGKPRPGREPVTLAELPSLVRGSATQPAR